MCVCACVCACVCVYACVCELDGALGGDHSFEVLSHGGLYLVVTEVVPVASGVDKKRLLVMFGN